MFEGRFTVRPTFDYARRPCEPMEDRGSVLFEAGDWRPAGQRLAGPRIADGMAS